MRKTLVPVLLLATVALSSSNILPILSMHDKMYGQTNDDTFNNQKIRDELSDVLFKIVYENDKPTDGDTLLREEYFKAKNSAGEYDTVKDENYDVNGFRKEQWHNYPRQLDRLNKYFYERYNSDKRNLDPDDPGELVDYSNVEDSPNDMTSNENFADNFNSLKSIDEVNKAAAIMNPLIILKIHLACLNKDKQFHSIAQRTTLMEDNFRQKETDDYNDSNENPTSNVMKVKREGKTRSETADSAQPESKNRMVNKRIFSLWSRLQSLNHKGHELHHRRHLYALYGLPDSDGGPSRGVLTAETRATFMRPPGSPLRWG